MPKQYSIKWLIDDAQARGVMTRGVKGMEAIEAAALKAATAMEKAHGQAVTTAVNGYAKVGTAAAATATAQVNGVNRIAAVTVATTAKKVSGLEAIELKWSVRDYKIRVKAEKDKERLDDFSRARFEKSVRDRESLELNWLAREYKARVAFEKRKEEAALGPAGRLARVQRTARTEEELAQVAYNRHMDATHQKRIAQIQKERYGTSSSFVEAIRQATGFDSAVTKLGVSLMAISAAKAVIQGVAKAFYDARENAAKFGVETLDFMVRVRKLAAVEGGRPTAAYAAKLAETAAEVGMNKEQYADFMEGFQSKGQIVAGDEKGKQISAKGYEEFAKQAAKMTTAQGVPSDIAGELFGAVLKVENFKKKGGTDQQQADSATARAGAMLKVLQAGPGKIAALAPQAIELMTALASENELEGQFRSAGEVGVITSVMAEFKAEKASVTAQAGIKALSAFDDKKRKPFYDRAGIKPGMSAIEKFQRANKVIGEEVAKGRPLESVLSGFGLSKDVRGARAISTAYKARDTTLAPQLATLAAMEGPTGIASIKKELSDRFGDEDIQYTSGKAAVDAADLGPERTQAKLYRLRAEAQLKKDGLDTSPYQGIKQKILGGLTGWQKGGREIEIDSLSLQMAQRAAGTNSAMNAAGTPFTAMYGNVEEAIRKLADATEANTKALQARSPANAATPAAIPVVRPNAGPAH